MLTDQKTSAISIIIPAINEEANIAAAIKAAAQGPVAEIIVVDGGSTDQTITNAKRAGAMVLSAPPGRANQMNTGARAATGDILLFLHADTILPLGFGPQVRDALNNHEIMAGAFRLKIEDTATGIRCIEMMANFRAKYLQMPYGDQAIFIRTEIFQRAGGFPEQPFLEDFALIRKLRRQGKIALLEMAVRTSARRWQDLGVVRTTLINQLVIIGYFLGVSPDSLRKLYRNSLRVKS
ncbi:MAG: TIGR04283 family arsenosugar biosynthesis glycosyltransferase [Proteobacteria bacterium]|nr:TIGR04283 family arsenosugar biosynthesis glycosyltransferase [Pseudomonadota bacterium]MBU1716915.1 TIGR04283 family arsenosugar biosynthesis glycosyltransferase [Pseudomonadota bacterium]